jgi:hypothetical protein
MVIIWGNMNTYQFERGAFFGVDISLLLFLIIYLIKFLTIKNVIKNAGINYFLFKKIMTVKINKIIAILVLGMIIILIISLFTGFLDMTITSLIFISVFILIFNFHKKYNNVDGIYENGIINSEELFEWKDIHSYIITDNNIFGYYKNGNTFECKDVSNIEEIKCLFEKNKIKEREKS